MCTLNCHLNFNSTHCVREGEGPLPVAFQYLILMIWRPCDLSLVMISSLASKWQVLKFGMLVFQPLYEVKLKTFKFKVFEAKNSWGECTMTIFFNVSHTEVPRIHCINLEFDIWQFFCYFWLMPKFATDKWPFSDHL